MEDQDKKGQEAIDPIEEEDDDIIELTDLADDAHDPEKETPPDPDDDAILAPPSYYDETFGVGKLLDMDEEETASGESGGREPDDYEETIGIGQLLQEETLVASEGDDEEETILDLDEETVIAPPEYGELTLGIGQLFEDDNGNDSAGPEAGLLTLDEETLMEQPADLYEQTIGISSLLDGETSTDDVIDLDDETIIAPPGEPDPIIDLDAETIISFSEEDVESDVEGDTAADNDIPLHSLDPISEEDQITEPFPFTDPSDGDREPTSSGEADLEEDETVSLDLEDIIESTTINREDIFDLEEAASPIVQKEPDRLPLENDTAAPPDPFPPDHFSESPEPAGQGDFTPESPFRSSSVDDFPHGNPGGEQDLLDLLGMDLDDTEPTAVLETATGEPDREGGDASGGNPPDALEAALERVIRKVFAEKLDAILSKAVASAVSKEIQKLKEVLISDTSMDE